MAKQDAKTTIVKFLAGDPKIILTSAEEKLLARWEFANDRLTEKKLKYTEIRDKIAFKFAVSKHTAENDIQTAQEVYGTNRKINKAYLLHLHIERMDETIELYKEQLFASIEGDGKRSKRQPDAKEVTALAKLSEAYTYAVNSAPAEVDRTKLPPPIFVFKLPEGVNLPLPPLPALLQATDEYLQYEMLNDGNDSQSTRSADTGKSDADTANDDTVC